ncbi:MAG: hypothetical protein CM1200mP40_25650 [Gammaproteobacteria bacterium]|nr:MAG: hypothetical protein CM1200mP40_25650 [Gammaproteobacteria bacterium]
MIGGLGKSFAYASILTSGNKVRITGQDVGRGTFSHRHAIVYDNKTGETHIPLQNIEKDQGSFTIYDSLLSEAAVLGFEYGYSTTTQMPW